MVTLKEIAQHCGVSVTTVSNIVNNSSKKVRDETRKKVMEAIEELGYHPNYFAQGLRRQRTKTIGVITEDLAQFTTPEIVEGIMKYCEEKKYRVLLQNLRLYSRWQDKWYNDETLIHSVLDPAMKELVSIKADGLIYIAGHEREIHLFEEKTDMPLVLAYCCSDESMTSVEIDDEEGGYQMVKYLLECGYEHIKVCAGRDNGVDHLRYVGAQRAMQECAAEGQKLQFVALGMNYEKRKASYDWLVQRRLPGTALFFLSDMYALEAIRFCADKKVAVPQQIGVAGYDDISYAQYSTPRLTTIKQDVQKKAQKAVEILLKWIEEGEEYPQREVELSVTLVKRKSVERD